MRLVALDFETYYDSKDYTLSKMGPIEYIRDERFLPLCVGVYASDVHAAGHYPPAVVELDTMGEYLHDLHLEQSDTFVVGHNMAGFDALVLSEYFGIHPAHILDTIVMARWCGISRVIPESHGSLTPYLGNGEKEAGTVVSNGKKSKEDFTPEDWDFFKKYCADDTLQCYKNCMDMLPYQTNDAIMFGDLTAKMATQPMIHLDVAMLDEYIKTLDTRAEEAMKELQKEFGFFTKEDFLKAIRSVPTFTQMLAHYGVEPPMKLSEAKTKTNRERILKAAQEAQAQGIDNRALLRAYDTPEVYEVYAPSLAKTDLDFVALAESPDEHVAALVRARLEFNSSIERSRAERLLKLGASGKPMPVMLKAFAAHTSRYGAGNSEGASDGTNVQNLSKRDPNKLLIRQAMKAPVGYKFVSVDSSQIEARMLAFIAKQTGLVNHFKEGRDPYAELAEKIFQVPAQEIHDGAKSGNKKLKAYRNVGKTCILSCFAGDVEVLTDMGWKRIDSVSDNDKLWDGETWQTHEGLICNGKKRTINLDGISVTPDHLIFAGSSWRTAEECQREPSYLNQALSIGDDALLTAQSRQIQANPERITLSNVNHAGKGNGFWNTHLLDAATGIASIVRLVIAGISNISRQSIRTPNPGQSLANSQCCKATGAYRKLSRERNDMSACAWFDAPVERNHIGCCRRIFGLANRQDAILAPRRKHGQHRIKSIGAMRIFAPTYHRDDDCLQGLLRKSIGVITRMISTMKVMAAGVSSFASPAAEIASPILSLCPVGTTRTLKSTGLTTTETMKSAISSLFQGRKTSRTIGALTNCSSASTSLKQSLVYDIRNVGPNHRYVVRTRHGALLVHNCGYGVGAQKFSDTLLRQGVKLDDDLDKHFELAKHAHNVYRMDNQAIVYFWDQCQGIVEAMERGAEGYFGGPNNKAFHYMQATLPKHTEKYPCIELCGTGYKLWYPNLHWEQGERKVEYFYDRQRGKNAIKTKIYGGALTENLIQALAFQLLMWQACRMNEAGIRLIANIHDAWLACVPEAKAEATQKAMELIMSAVPPWLEGFPVACEGEIGDTYEIA